MLKKTISQLLSNVPTTVHTRDAKIILAHLLGKNQTFVLAHPEFVVSFFTCLSFRAHIKKRKKGWPLAYLLGHKEFFGLDFLVNTHTLIPRPETEVLVEAVLKQVSTLKTDTNSILIDVGTGSGCIPIAIAKNTSQKLKIMGLDISQKALTVAISNAARTQTSVEFLYSNVLSAIPISAFSTISQVIITANLPYLTNQEFEAEPSIHYEPKTALVASGNGLALYLQLLTQIHAIPQKNREFSLFCEVNPEQINPLRTAINQYFPQADFLVYKDLAGLNRVLCASWIG